MSDETVERMLRAMPHTCAQDVIDAHPDGADLRFIGRVFGISRERVRQIEDHAMSRHLRGRAERANLRQHVEADEDHLAPWERERSTKGGGYVRFVETPEPHAAPTHLAHLPLVGDVADVGESFWCGWIRAEMPAMRCIARQLARNAVSHGAPMYHGCATCTAGRELTARVRVRDDAKTTCNAPRPAPEPRTEMTESTTTRTAAHDALPEAAHDPTLCKCGKRPPASVTPTTRPGEEDLCASCRRIRGMELNGTKTGGYHPKKGAAPEAKTEAPATAAAPVKRGPGRPRKDSAATKPASKRGPGRPPKSTSTPASKPVAAESAKAMPQALPKDPETRIAWASRALACAMKVGGIDRLEAFVKASLAHGLLS